MSVQQLSASVPPLSSIPPAQERTPSFSAEPTIDPPSGKKTTSEKKKKNSPKKRVAEKAKQVEPVDAPASQQARCRYEPYRKAEPTTEPEGSLPANPEDLETLDETAKMLYKSDREVLEYIEALKHRTAAMLEHVNRTSSQLRSHKGAMERMQLFVNKWQQTDDHWTHQRPFGDGNGVFPTVEDHLPKYVRSLNHRALAYTQLLGTLVIPNSRTTTLETFSGTLRLNLPIMMRKRKISPDLKLPLPDNHRSLLVTKMRMASSTPKTR